jgi:glycosyltransferase involved in cell wall biosynthesis
MSNDLSSTNTRLRVAHIITQLELGGAQQNTLYTVTHLDKQRFEACLITGPGGLLDEEAQQSGIPTSFISSLVRPIRPWKDIFAFRDIYRLLRHIQPDIVHTHSSKAGILGRIAAYLAGVPVIIHTYHGFGFTPDQTSWMRRFLIGVEKLCAFLNTHLIFVSEENRRTAEALGIGKGKPSSLIRSGIALKELHISPVRQELGIPESAWVVASVGNFKPQKNPMDLAKTATAALKEDPTLHFLLVGDGELRPKVESWVNQEGFASNVHFLGWRRDIPEILTASNIFLLTSRWEGLPRALVEAFAARRPAICYAVDGVQELIEEGQSGYLVPPGDIETAKRRILELKAKPDEAVVMGRRGQERVQREFDIDAMVHQQEELYAKLSKEVPSFS